MSGHAGCGCGHAHAETETSPSGATKQTFALDGKAAATVMGDEVEEVHVHDGEGCCPEGFHAADCAGEDACSCGGYHAEGCAGGATCSCEGMEAEGCGEGCGCAHGEGADGMLHPMEAAALRGFLSGVYASQLNTEKLTEYLTQMGADPASEFGRPAQFLSTQLKDLADAQMLGKEPPAWALLDSVSGGEDDADDEDGSEE